MMVSARSAHTIVHEIMNQFVLAEMESIIPWSMNATTIWQFAWIKRVVSTPTNIQFKIKKHEHFFFF